MPRTFSRPEQDYAIGTYGPFQVDGFTNANTDFLRVSFTVNETWPVLEPLITGQMRWDDGAGADFAINSPPRARDGSIATTVASTVHVRQLPNGKAAVKSGTLALTLHAPIRTAISLVAG